jgi:hypothetical protein
MILVGTMRNLHFLLVLDFKHYITLISGNLAVVLDLKHYITLISGNLVVDVKNKH